MTSSHSKAALCLLTGILLHTLKKKSSKLAKTLVGVKREKKPLTAAQKLQQIARQQYLATETDRDLEALNGWE